MNKGFVFCILFLIFIFQVKGQDTISVNQPEVNVKPLVQDSAVVVKDEKIDLTKEQISMKPAFKPNPTKAVIYSAIFPGLGQIYNRKYWKLPIIYGGLVGLAYGISWNGQYYTDYKDAYRGIANNPRDPENFEQWKDMAGVTNEANVSDSDIERFKSSFKRKKDFYRRNRDLCIIGVVAVYAICMIDAYVDAQLFDFDISPDLSLKVEPAVMQPSITNNRSFGLQCSLTF